MPRNALTLQCPAKVNLALSVGPPREEDGLHPICSWMVAVGFYDTLNLARSSDGRSLFDTRFADDAPLTQPVDWPLSSDMVFRAHGLMQEHVRKELPVNVEVRKVIPAGAGLGGGSSDAAGMLTGLNQLFSLGLHDEPLIRLGLRLGSDVGFMVWVSLGKSSAIVSGTGERIETAPAGGQMIHMVLILPPVPCATNEVYRAFDQITHESDIDEQRVRSLAGVCPPASDGPWNDLTEAAFEVQPALRGVRDQVHEATGLPVHLSGSGSAMFVIAADAHEGMRLTQAIKSRTGLSAIYTGSLPG